MSSEEKKSSSGLIRTASFIVDKRMLFFLLYIIAIIFSFFSSNWVNVENDISRYLSSETETRQGMDLMEDEFVTFGSAKVMVANITYEDALRLKERIESLESVSGVTFADADEPQEDFVKHYNRGSALFDVTFRYSEKDERAVEALDEVKALLKDYDIYVSTSLGNQQADMAHRPCWHKQIIPGFI